MGDVTNPNRVRAIFCEGASDSPDYLVLKRFLTTRPSKSLYEPDIQPLGGKHAIKRFAEGYGKANWIAITDRDLDMPPNRGNLLTWDKDKEEAKQRVFLTGLTSIESYFLDARLLHDYLSEHNPYGKNIPSIADIEQTLQQTATELAEYQAVRWALQELRELLRRSARERKLMRTPDGVFDLPNRLTSDDGKLPTSLNLAYCRATAHQFIVDFVDITQMATVGQFDQYLQHYRQQFADAEFLKNEYKQWFHGKDVFNRWLQHPSLESHSINHASYKVWAAEHLDLTLYPDLQAFARRWWA